MKITEIRTRVVQWRGKTVPLPPHFCTNPMDAVSPMLTRATMGTFTFHGWLIVEIFTDNGLVGIGNAALSPLVTKQVIDLYLKPLLIGAIRGTSNFSGSTCIARRWRLAARASAWSPSARWTSRCGTLLGKSAKQPVYRLLGGRTKAANSRLCQPALQHAAGRTRRESKKYKTKVTRR
jgi:L-rhamnonate dehydratase